MVYELLLDGLHPLKLFRTSLLKHHYTLSIDCLHPEQGLFEQSDIVFGQDTMLVVSGEIEHFRVGFLPGFTVGCMEDGVLV